MRITYRRGHNKDYWEKRWSAVSIDGPNGNTEVYPLKYALKAVSMLTGQGRLLDAGCGAGRVTRYFHSRGYDVEGFDFIGDVIQRLKDIDPSLKVNEGDITNLRYENGRFACVMGFGLYHNLPLELQDKALKETYRIMQPGGVLCASFRADNITTRMSDWLRERELRELQDTEAGDAPREVKEFHKINMTLDEIKSELSKNGFSLLATDYVENMPVLYKFAVFRHRDHRVFDEALGRREGYKLNAPARVGQWLFKKVAAKHACNVYVVYAKRKAES